MVAFAVATLLGVAAPLQSSAQIQEPKRTQTSSGHRNLKVLGALTDKELATTMKEFSRALSVKCDFCHTTTGTGQKATGWDLDTKPMKLKTRDMLLMMARINKNEKTVDGQATCWMCHHGHPEPETHAPTP